MAAPANLTRTTVYTFAEGNVARDPAVRQYADSNRDNLYSTPNALPSRDGIITTYCNTTNGNNNTQTLRITDGTRPGSGASTGWNTWSRSGTMYVVIMWPTPYTIDSTRVEWWTDSNVQIPTSATVEYWNGTAWTAVTNMKNPSGSAVTHIGNAARGNWNAVTFDPVSTSALRLNLVRTAEPVGIGEWEVFGVSDPKLADLAWLKSQLQLADLLDDVVLPTTGPSGSAFTYESSNPAVFSNTGVVTRPAIGSDDAAGTLKATASLEGESASDVFNWSVIALKSDEQVVDFDLAALNIGSTDERKTNFTFPTTGEWGSAITWDAQGSPYLWTDGTVLRPPLNYPDANITLTATASFGGATKTRTWTVTIPAIVSGRGIASVDESALVINSPYGMAPKLPNDILVTYTGGTQEYRRIKWDNTAKATERAQAAYPVGQQYTVTGNIIGDNSTANGYPVTASITVVDEPLASPALSAMPLPLNAVQLNGDNLLTRNRNGYITYFAGNAAGTTTGLNIQPFYYNYRYFFGQDTTGLSPSTGWDRWDGADKIKGHGMGHVMSGLALAYMSGGASEAQKAQLISKMTTMVNESRQAQELTFVRSDETNSPLSGPTGWREARDLYPTDAEVMSLSGTAEAWRAEAMRDPARFGYGFVHGMVPETLIMNERYAGYGSGATQTWAPYYALHKQLDGWVYIYDALKDDPNPEVQAIANKSLDVARDMGLWVWNRLYYRTHRGTNRPNAQTPGYLEYAWRIYIGGENGGVAETMVKISERVRARDKAMADHPYAANETEAANKLLTAATFFDNNTGYNSDTTTNLFNDLEQNVDSLRGRHANQHIPQITGALQIYRQLISGQTITPEEGKVAPHSAAGYWNIGKNFFDINNGRYAHTVGGMGAGEMWPSTPYAQAANSANNGCETCCAHNLLEVTMNLNRFEPENAEYMDFYERLFYGQMVGSTIPGSTNNQNSYLYNLGQNVTRSRGSGSPSSHCCKGTGVENHTKYQEAAYFTSLDNDIFYVTLYMPSTAQWDRGEGKGITQITQDCLWPAETSTITIDSVGENAAFNLKFRVPYWATKGYTLKINGVTVASGKDFRIYAETGVRTWKAGDKITIDLPYSASVFYAPDKHSGQWAGSVTYGPMIMAAVNPGTSNWNNIPLDSYMGNITINERNESGMPIITTPGHQGTGTLTFNPHYSIATDSISFSTYFEFTLVGDASAEYKLALFEALNAANAYNEADYTEASFAVLKSAIAAAVAAYQSDTTTPAQIDNQIANLQSAIAQLVSEGPLNLTALKAAIAAARVIAPVGYVNNDYTWDSWQAFSGALASAEALLAKAEAGDVSVKQNEVTGQVYALDRATALLVHYNDVSRTALAAALAIANARVEGDYAWYSWEKYVPIRVAANAAYNSRVSSQNDIDVALQALNDFILTPKDKEIDMVLFEAIKEMIERIKTLDPADYVQEIRDLIWGADLESGLLSDAEVLVYYESTGGLDPTMVEPMYNRLKDALAGIVTINVKSAITQLVGGLAANLVIEADAAEGAVVTVTAFGVSAPVVNGVATIKLPAGVVPAVTEDTDFTVTASIDGKSVSVCTIKVTPYNSSIWQAYVVEGEGGKANVKFNAPVALKADAEVTVNGVVTAATADGDSLLLAIGYGDLKEEGNVVIVKGVKFPALFPSYSFTFTIKK